MKKAFTLIELLVVVLIIGILSAIALPQYQRAVGKARASEAKIALKAIQQATQIAHLESGKKDISEGDLAIAFPSSNYWNYEISECCGANGWGCVYGAYYKEGDDPSISLFDSTYHTACLESDDGFELSCSGDKCPQFGFTRPSQDGYVWVEP